MEKKMTKKDFYGKLIDIVSDAEMSVEESDELIEFLNKQIDLINSKAEKAKIRNAEKKAKGDELRDIVQDILSDEYQTIDAILAQVDIEDVTRAKVTARLTSLCKNGIAENTDVKDDEGRKLKAYRLISEKEEA